MAESTSMHPISKEKSPFIGRPPATFDLEILRRAAAVGCTQANAATMIGVSLATFKRRLEDDADFRAAFVGHRPAETVARKAGPVLSINVERGLASELSDLARERGVTRHAVVVEAIVEYVARTRSLAEAA